MSDVARNLIEALGGKENIAELESCITRLRVVLVSPGRLNEKQVKAQGAVGILKLGSAVQIVLGTHAERIEREMKALLK
ncbi:MAG TPA: PTS glucose/sucrose transporter subunit IIB [Symbiobacteriaceae bacterium]|nr:PTS glucose/sucrose transporter subunit IIB [Symbiobacteriaceae bacterium]